jgi:hypothetical protein
MKKVLILLVSACFVFAGTAEAKKGKGKWKNDN